MATSTTVSVLLLLLEYDLTDTLHRLSVITYGDLKDD